MVKLSVGWRVWLILLKPRSPHHILNHGGEAKWPTWSYKVKVKVTFSVRTHWPAVWLVEFSALLCACVQLLKDLFDRRPCRCGSCYVVKAFDKVLMDQNRQVWRFRLLVLKTWPERLYKQGESKFSDKEVDCEEENASSLKKSLSLLHLRGVDCGAAAL